jgi:putative zinc finger protein
MAAPLSCDHYEELLADYLLHALEPEAVQVVTEHLSTCARCWAQLTASEAVLAHLLWLGWGDRQWDNGGCFTSMSRALD